MSRRPVTSTQSKRILEQREKRLALASREEAQKKRAQERP